MNLLSRLKFFSGFPVSLFSLRIFLISTILISLEQILLSSAPSRLEIVYSEIIVKLVDLSWWVLAAYVVHQALQYYLLTRLDRDNHISTMISFRRLISLLVLIGFIPAILTSIFDLDLTLFFAIAAFVITITVYLLYPLLNSLFTGIACKLTD